MAFCSGCGSKLEDQARFCPSCGASQGAPAVPAQTPPVTAATAPAPAAYAPIPAPPPQQGSGALKTVLIVVGVIVLLLVLGMIGMMWTCSHMIKKGLRVNESGGNTTVNTPFGKVTSGNDANAFKVAQELGIEVYPGAEPVKGSAATVSFGGVTIGGADFETSDSVDKVGEFYKAKYPNSNLNVADENSQSVMVSTPSKGVVMISIEKKPDSNKTKISLALMGGPKPQQ